MNPSRTPATLQLAWGRHADRPPGGLTVLLFNGWGAWGMTRRIWLHPSFCRNRSYAVPTRR